MKAEIESRSEITSYAKHVQEKVSFHPSRNHFNKKVIDVNSILDVLTCQNIWVIDQQKITKLQVRKRYSECAVDVCEEQMSLLTQNKPAFGFKVKNKSHTVLE